MDDLKTVLHDHSGLDGLARLLGQHSADPEPQATDAAHEAVEEARAQRQRNAILWTIAMLVGLCLLYLIVL